VGQTVFLQRPSLRIFQDEAERDEFHRREGTIIAGLVRTPLPGIDSRWFNAPFGGFEMPTAARLDVSRYLDASRQFLQRHNAYLVAEIEPKRDVEVVANGVRLPKLGVSSRAITFCRGFDAVADSWFGGIRFNAAKGEILSLRIPELHEERVIHRGIWLAPVEGELFRAGSTYVWDDLEPQPTPAGRAEIEARLRLFLRLPFEVIGHQAAVRPVIDAGYPVLGLHPMHPQLAYLNGLGSKGSLLAPFFSDQLASCLLREREPDPEVNVRKFLGKA
jgi:glycine oxidase